MSLNNMGMGLELGWRDQGAIPGLANFRREFQQAHGTVSRGAPEMSTKMDALQGALGQLQAGAATTALGIGIMAGPLALATGAVGPFQDALSQLRAVSGATAEQMMRFHDAAIDAGVATQFDPTQAAVALGDLAQAGFNTDDSLKLLIPTLDLAAGSLGQLSPSDAAGLASQAMKAFGISTDDAGKSVDQMLQAVNVFALSARELPLALGTAARGAGSLNQSLDETLVALGLVKNVIPGVERASTSVAVAMEKMVDPKVQASLKRMGADVVDSTGKFRPFLDVIGDLMPALDKMTDSKRAAFLQDTFGAEALGGINAIMGQVKNGIQTSTGEILKGGAAIQYLRDQFKNADGTARKFSEELLKDLPGQLRLLKGSISTLLIVIGESFATAFKPAVVAILNGVNTVLNAIRSMPESMRGVIASVVMFTATLIGGAIALQGLRQSLGGVFTFIQAAVGGIGLTTALVIGGIVLALVAFKAAYDSNFGGFADAVNRAYQAVSLAYNGLVQLFTQGGFSGAVRAEFQKGENDGIRAFAIQVYMWVGRIGNFLSNMGKSFSAVIDAAEPTFARLGAAIERIFDAFGMAQDGPKKAGSAFDTFGRVGVRVGTAIADALVIVADYLTTVINFWAGFKSSISSSEFVKPISKAFTLLGESIGTIMTALGALNVTMSSTGSVAGTIGSFIGGVFVFGIRAAANVVQTLATMLANLATVFSGAFNLMAGILTGDGARAWLGFKQIVFGVISGIVDTFAALIQFVANGLDMLSKVGGNTTNYADQVADWRTKTREGMAGSFGVDQAGQAAATAAPVPNTAVSAVSAVPRAMAGYAPQETGSVAAVGKAIADAIGKARGAGAPQTINVMLDGQVLASGMSSVNEDNASRSFTPLAPES